MEGQSALSESSVIYHGCLLLRGIRKVGFHCRKFPLYGLIMLCMSINPICPQSTTAGLSTVTVVGISIIIFLVSVVISSLVSFSAGVLLAALITYCCCVRRREKNSGQPQVSSSENPQSAPVYDEVVAGKLELKENVTYGPVDTLEMKQNPSYGPVRH